LKHKPIYAHTSANLEQSKNIHISLTIVFAELLIGSLDDSDEEIGVLCHTFTTFDV